MNISSVETIVRTHGPIAAAFIVICVLLFFVLKWVFKNQDAILQMAKAQNEAWREAIQRHTDSAKEFHTQMKVDHKAQKEAATYQREEHNKMIATLIEILGGLRALNGEKKQF